MPSVAPSANNKCGLPCHLGRLCLDDGGTRKQSTWSWNALLKTPVTRNHCVETISFRDDSSLLEALESLGYHTLKCHSFIVGEFCAFMAAARFGQRSLILPDEQAETYLGTEAINRTVLCAGAIYLRATTWLLTPNPTSCSLSE